jgi:UDP-GlcNAc:undecaprenyl-phosphate GlcNAc-1-phosphate transferase
MNYGLYLLPFLVSLLVSLLVCLVILFLLKKTRIFDSRIAKRHLHKHFIPRFGGVAIFLGFLVAIFSDKNLVISKPIFGILVGLLIIFAISFWDDFFEIDWKKQLFFQFLAIFVAFNLGAFPQNFTNPFNNEIIFFNNQLIFFLGILIIGGWVLALMNSINWIDGIDGVGGGVCLIGTLALFFLSLKPEVNQPPIGILAISLAGGILGFLVLNFYPAKIFAGTTGAMTMGYLLAMLSIFAGAKIATTLLVMAIPIVDALWVVFERLTSGQSIFEADRRHLHYKLLQLGFSQRSIFLFYSIFTILISIFALKFSGANKLIIFAFSLLSLSVLVFYVKNKLVKIVV